MIYSYKNVKSFSALAFISHPGGRGFQNVDGALRRVFNKFQYKLDWNSIPCYLLDATEGNKSLLEYSILATVIQEIAFNSILWCICTWILCKKCKYRFFNLCHCKLFKDPWYSVHWILLSAPQAIALNSFSFPVRNHSEFPLRTNIFLLTFHFSWQ